VIALLLVGSILGSVETAVDKTLQEQPLQLATQDELMKLQGRVTVLESRVERDEGIAVETWRCFNRALVGAGTDLGSTAFALAKAPDDAVEGNPLGFSVEARVALKFAQLGATGTGCYMLNKDRHGTAAKFVSWSSLGIQLAATVNNLLRGFGVIGRPRVGVPVGATR